MKHTVYILGEDDPYIVDDNNFFREQYGIIIRRTTGDRRNFETIIPWHRISKIHSYEENGEIPEEVVE